MYTNEINAYERTLLLSTNLPKTAGGNFDPDNLEFTDILGKEQAKINSLSTSEAADDNLILDTSNLDSIKTDTITTAETKYDAYFQEASETYNIPVYLLKAVAKQESNFQADCVSKSGATGIMQLMPATASSLGVTNSYDARQNIMGGAKYLAANLKTFDNDVSLALAAYNAGPNAVKKYNGIPPYEETQNYVPKVLKYAEMYKELEETTSKTIGGNGSLVQNTDYSQIIQLLNAQLNNTSGYNQLAQLLNSNSNSNTTANSTTNALEQLMSSGNASNWLSQLNL